MQANRLYWTLLHISIKRLYAITFGIIIGILGVWLYFWYLPLNRSIARFATASNNQEFNIDTNVNTHASVKINNEECLTLIADYALQGGILMQRCKMNNQHAIIFEAQGTVAQLVSFFNILQRSSQSWECLQMRINRDHEDICNMRMELTIL